MNVPGPVASIVERLKIAPDRADISLILRHAEREVFPVGALGTEVPLTARGVGSAEMLGEMLPASRTVSAVSSPVPRCVQTADAILRGVGRDGNPVLDHRLGDPGPFVVDPEACGRLFLELPISEVVQRQLSDAQPPMGMRSTSEGVEMLLGLAADHLGWQGRLNIYVTHDAILAVLVAHLFRLPLQEAGWPGFLDGLLLWRSAERLHFTWRGLHQASHPIGRQRDGL